MAVPLSCSQKESLNLKKLFFENDEEGRAQQMERKAVGQECAPISGLPLRFSMAVSKLRSERLSL